MSLRVSAAVPERGVELELEIPSGVTTALVGPNGAGKSTLLALVGGTLRPRSGRIVLGDRVLAEVEGGRVRTWVPPHARGVATLGQDPMLFPHLTALENIMFGLRAAGVPAARARDQARGWLERIGLAELAARMPSQLSGGQAQRVAIARALVIEPDLLLLDEPLAALDIDVAPALREQLRRFLGGRSTLVVTHDVLDAMTLARDVAVLEAGALAEHGRTLDVLTRPRSPFAARFAGLNLLTGQWDGQAVTLDAQERLLTGSAVTAPTGARVHAAFRPAAVDLHTTGPPPSGASVLRRSVSALQPLGDLVRLRAGDLAADLTPQQVASLHLQPGTEVELTVPAQDVSVYPALAPGAHGPAGGVGRADSGADGGAGRLEGGAGRTDGSAGRLQGGSGRTEGGGPGHRP